MQLFFICWISKSELATRVRSITDCIYTAELQVSVIPGIKVFERLSLILSKPSANLINTICDILSTKFSEGRCSLLPLLKSRKMFCVDLGNQQNVLHCFFENKIEGLCLQTKGEFVT